MSLSSGNALSLRSSEKFKSSSTGFFRQRVPTCRLWTRCRLLSYSGCVWVFVLFYDVENKGLAPAESSSSVDFDC